MAAMVADKVVVVTGAGGGIGRDIAIAMAANGARVVVNDIGASLGGEVLKEAGGEGAAQRVVREIEAAGGEAAASTDSVGDDVVDKPISQAYRAAIHRRNIMADSILNQPHFQDAGKAREYLEAIRWPHGPVCPHCGVVGGHYALNGVAHRPGVYKCFACREQFTVTVGTVFERSKVPLHQWMQAVYLICSSKKGCSSHQLQRTLGVQYKTAWFMNHRLREAMKSPGGIMGNGGGTIEADETFVGRKPGTKVRRGHGHKEAVFSLVERNGNVRAFHVNDVTAKTLKDKLDNNACKAARLMTDDAGQYEAVGKTFLDHQSVNHSAGEYVRGDAHTHTVEGFFSIFKRGMYGVYQHCSSHHLERYTTEFYFRYNHRQTKVKIDGKWELVGFSDAERTTELLKNISGKRLTYRRTDKAENGVTPAAH